MAAGLLTGLRSSAAGWKVPIIRVPFFSINWPCCFVTLKSFWIRLTAARHPLMDRRAAVPLDFTLGEELRGVVITGPNTGGKTVALKTVALCCMLAQWGLHVPCQEARVCMNSQYLCDIGDGQSLSENLSTFSAHITNVLDILSRVNPESLVIMDELGSGTDPTEGMGIAIAILEALRESGCLFLVTTHYPEVKEYAARTQGVTNARMTFDQDSLQPLYRMVIGEAGASCAFAIAERLGMSRAMLDVARQAAYGNAPAAQSPLIQTSGGPRIERDRPAPRRGGAAAGAARPWDQDCHRQHQAGGHH